MMKLVDIPDLKSGAERRAGSTPAPGTITLRTIRRSMLAASPVLWAQTVMPARAARPKRRELRCFRPYLFTVSPKQACSISGFIFRQISESSGGRYSIAAVAIRSITCSG